MNYEKVFGVVLAITFIITSGFFVSGIHSNSQSQILEMNGEIIIESIYGSVKVSEDNGLRTLYIGDGSMGVINIDNKFQKVDGEEYFYLMEDLIASSNPNSVLMLGVGAGVVPSRLNELHNIPVDGVDINSVVLDVAVKYFNLVPSDTLKLYTGDARMYLKHSDKRYDVIAMDTFDYINGRYIIPVHLTTKEYYELAKSNINEGGALVILLVNDEEGEFVKSQILTIESVFNYVYVFSQDSVVVASDKELQFSNELLKWKKEKSINGGKVYRDHSTIPIIS